MSEAAATEVMTTRSGIMRTNRAFVVLSKIGECDEKGKAIFSRSFKHKVIAEPNAPFATMLLPIIHVILDHCHWTDAAAAEADMAALKKYVEKLHVNIPANDAGEREEK